MKIIDWFKNFKYKGITGLTLLIISSILNGIFFNPIIMWITFFSFCYMLTYTFCYVFAGVSNYKKEGNPVLGTLLQILVIGFVLFAINALGHFIFNY